MTSKKVLHEVTCAIYKAGQDKPAVRWSFFFKYDEDSVESLSEVLERMNATCGIKERANEIFVMNYKIKLSVRRMEPEPEFPKGRVFAIDTESQFTLMMPLIQQNYEIIVKVVETEVRSVNQILMDKKSMAKRKLPAESDDVKPAKKANVGRPPINAENRMLIFKKKVKDKFPDVVIKSPTLVSCACSVDIHLHKSFGTTNLNKRLAVIVSTRLLQMDNMKSCNAKRVQKAATSGSAVKLKEFLLKHSTSEEKKSTSSKLDEVQSDDSLHSGGLPSDEEPSDILMLQDVQDNTWLDESPPCSPASFRESSCILENELHDFTSSFESVSSLSSESEYDSDGLSTAVYADQISDNIRRFTYWDSICEKLQDVLNSGLLQKNHIFYVYIDNVLNFVKQVEDPKKQFHWDERILEFVETIEYHGHKKVLNILRGPGFLGTGKGGIKHFDWKSWNLPLPSHFARHKNVSGYTTENGIHCNLLRSFLEICAQEDSVVTSLLNNGYTKVIPVAMQKDGMALKPGLMVDIRQGVLIGGTLKIDNEFIERHPNPSPEMLKSLFVQEAEVTCLTSLDNKLTLPVGVDYNCKGISSAETFEKFNLHCNQLQICLQCIKSGHINTENGVIVSGNCSSKCETCLEQRSVCQDCKRNGQCHIDPSLRCCGNCLRQKEKCVKLMVLVITMDSESKNKGAEEMFEERKKNGSIDPNVSLACCVPDGVHVGKRLARHFSNWFLLVDGCRINRVLLRTLRGDPSLKDKLRPHLTVAACRNRDRMDVDASLEISSKPVRNIVSGIKTITHTIIPEKYRLYEDNKKGTLSSPIAVCITENGMLLIADAAKGKLFSARLHYPVDVVEITGKLNHPIGVAYTKEVIYVSDLTEKAIFFLDLKGNSVYDPDRMTIKQLQKALKDQGLWENKDRTLRKQTCNKSYKNGLKIIKSAQKVQEM
ncbi:unnamed protein product [Mytilus edulis]|uniref:Uncharacterized protein n=1 Tax=Mytilus edulis TaxID=6550 RepID=A0A8S3TVA4_MYTED|nr:unnamed protein product [Mytilus edulis]